MSILFVIITIVLVVSALLAGYYLAKRRSLKGIPFKDPDLLLPDIIPPSTGVKLLEINVNRKVMAGKPIHVLVTSDGKPLPNAEVKLFETNTNNEIAKGMTNGIGVAEFTAPNVQKVGAYHVSVSRQGYAFYYPDSDPRTWDYTIGFYPMTCFNIWPTIAPAPAIIATQKQRIWVDVGFGLTSLINTACISDLEDTAEKKGWEFDEDWWVGDGTMFDHVRDLGPDDIWVFSGHSKDFDDDGKADALAGWRPGALVIGYTTVNISQICENIGPNGAPGVVFLDACGTESLLDDLVKCCVKLALGWSGKVPSVQSSGAMANFFKKFLNGGTLQEAIDAADAQVNNTLGTKTNASLKFRTKLWITNPTGMTLDDFKSATREESEIDDEYWDNFAWDEMPQAARDHWETLGWDEDSWDEDDPDPDSASKSWDDLTDEEQHAAEELGYTEDRWND